MDIAASIQAVTEDAVLRLAEHAVESFATRDLCLAGGVALNCVANGKLLRSGSVDRLWTQPAAGDAGGALGAALAAYHLYLDRPRRACNGLDGMMGAFLGPEFSQAEIEGRLRAAGARYQVLDQASIINATVDALVEPGCGRLVSGTHGVRTAGAGRPFHPGQPAGDRHAEAAQRQDQVPRVVPAVCPGSLLRGCGPWFELREPSPYMLLVAGVAGPHRLAISEEQNALFGLDKLNVRRSTIPAVTHVNYSARLQTVHRETNPRFHQLLSRFRDCTGCPILVNTSFNVRGEPIVCTPDDAFRCFMGTDLDVLVAGDCFLRKPDQLATLRRDYEHNFEPD